MNKKELEKIKQKALEEHIPIIMDDTLEGSKTKKNIRNRDSCWIFSNVFF